MNFMKKGVTKHQLKQTCVTKKWRAILLWACIRIFVILALYFIISLIKADIESNLSNKSSLHLEKRFNEYINTATTVMKNPSNGQEEAPRVIFHVGPPKTATSTIQCSLAKLSQLGKLEKLGIHVIEVQTCRPPKKGKARMSEYRSNFPNVVDEDISAPASNELTSYDEVIRGGSWLPACLKSFTAKDNEVPLCWSESYLRYVKNYYRYGNMTTFIISNENIGNLLGTFESNRCGNVFDSILTSLREVDDDFEIDIVLTQRYLWEILISYFGEQYNKKFRVKPALEKWPGKGGRKVPTIMSYILNERPIDLTGLIRCLRYASDHNPRVHLKVIDFHDGNDILRTFFDFLSIKEEIMNSLMDVGVSRVNEAGKRQNVPYDRIAIAAFEAGLVNDTGRAEVRNIIGKHYDDMFEGVPPKQNLKHLACPTKVFNMQLLNESIALQREVFPDRSQKHIEDEIIPMFEKAVNSGYLCDVNGTTVIMDKSFRKLLEENM